jgi:tetratricopeptide (TPR) repeat protein
MARPLAKSPFVLLALGLWMLAYPASSAEDDDPNALNHQVTQLIEQGKYQEAIPIAERAVEVAKHARGPEDPRPAMPLIPSGSFLMRAATTPKLNRSTAQSLNKLGDLYQRMHEDARAEPLYQQPLGIFQKVLGSEHRSTAEVLSNLAELYRDMPEYAKAEPLYQEAFRLTIGS